MMSGHFAFSFDSSESIRLVVITEPTVWLYNRLMPNQSIASMPPIAGQRRYPLKVLYTVDVALQGKKTRYTIICSIESRYFWGTQYIESDTFFVNVDTFYKNIASSRTPRDMLAR